MRQLDYLRCHRLSAGDEFPCVAAHLYQIYGNASTLVGYFTRPDGSLHEITRVKFPATARRVWRDSDSLSSGGFTTDAPPTQRVGGKSMFDASVADGHASVTVADTGVGIEPASEPHLFDALYTTKDEGLGLGLSISRKIVAAHGGRIWLEKNTTQGATFTFALPVRQTSELSGNN